MRNKKIFIKIVATILTLIMSVVGFTLPSSAAVIEDDLVSPNTVTITDGMIRILENIVGIDAGQAYTDIFFWYSDKGTADMLIRLYAEVRGGAKTTHTTEVYLMVSDFIEGESDSLSMSSVTESSRLLKGEVTLEESKINDYFDGRGYCEVDCYQTGNSDQYWGAVYGYEWDWYNQVWYEAKETD